MANPFLGEIRIFGGNFAPTGWALCNGQLLAISSNTALFALLGTMYGGDGRSTFALPNLQGTIPLGAGSGPGLTTYDQGETGGEAAVTLSNAQLAPHAHTLTQAAFLPPAFAGPATTNVPGSSEAFATAVDAHGSPVDVYIPAANAVSKALLPAVAPVNLATQQAPATSDAAGGGQAHTNLQPYLVMTYIIAVQGVFPARS